MTEPASRIGVYEELLRRLASGVRAAQLYAPDHPLVARNVDGLQVALKSLLAQQPSVVVGIVGEDLVVGETPLPKVSGGMSEFIHRLTDHHIERIAFERGVTQDELVALMQKISKLTGRSTIDAEKDLSSAHVRIGRLKAEDRRQDGIASDLAAIRQLYSNAVSAAEVAWETAAGEGMPDAPAALQAVEGLAEAVTQNRTALVALTAMRNYDNYTFTHMVNVSILTMGQAREPQPRDDALQHLRRLRCDAIAAGVPTGVSHRSHPRRAQAERRHAVRPAPGAAVRAAARHLPAGQPREAELRRSRCRPARAR